MSNKMKNVGTDWKTKTLSQTISTLKVLAKENNLEWTEELDADFSSEIEFMLGSKGRWLLCHIGKSYPFVVRFRLVGDKNYERVRPKDFIDVATQMLLH